MQTSTTPQLPDQTLLPTSLGLPTIYFNGFGSGFGAIDTSLILHVNQTPIVELKMSYAIAKSLSEALANSVSTYEKHSGTTVIGATELGKKVLDSIASSKGN